MIERYLAVVRPQTTVALSAEIELLAMGAEPTQHTASPELGARGEPMHEVDYPIVHVRRYPLAFQPFPSFCECQVLLVQV